MANFLQRRQIYGGSQYILENPTVSLNAHWNWSASSSWDFGRFTVQCNYGTAANIRVKPSLSTPWGYTKKAEVQLHSFLTSALDGGKWLTSRPGSLTPRKDPLNSRLCRTQSRYGRLGENKYLLPLPGFKFRTVQPVAKSLFPCSQKPTTSLFPKTDNQCLSSLPIY